jgi:copper homeostasis protein CutC
VAEALQIQPLELVATVAVGVVPQARLMLQAAQLILVAVVAVIRPLPVLCLPVLVVRVLLS